MGLDLREVAAPPWEEDLLVTARPKGVVDVWSLMRGARCVTFETVWGSGGWRGALVPGEHPVVVAGAWEHHGVCGYDLTGQRLWQDRSRTNVEAVTALTGGRVVVTHLRRATRVLEAATGEEMRTLRGALRVIALRPDLTLAVGGGWCRLLDRSLDPLGSRISTGLNTVWCAASDGEHLAINEIGGPLRILDSDGQERARIAEHFRHLLHDPVTNTWVAVQDFGEKNSLLRFSNDGEVLERRPWDLHIGGTATMRGGRTLILNTNQGGQVVNCADWSVRGLEAT
ncbi:hypothetical protein [Arthrobacter sp. zg-Y769]|uniref:hypothetical protein n=1 Tax=Arthrobacter sp. zg-Y769 TaxID=2894191 RepID=UPI001E3C69FD|nr:hypothetical protein [Arthrobacter sp. zg-Y769]MCC9204572.1 hypothetical protein [Arthrobacter sp. zg-Y769]